MIAAYPCSAVPISSLRMGIKPTSPVALLQSKKDLIAKHKAQRHNYQAARDDYRHKYRIGQAVHHSEQLQKLNSPDNHEPDPGPSQYGRLAILIELLSIYNDELLYNTACNNTHELQIINNNLDIVKPAIRSALNDWINTYQAKIVALNQRIEYNGHREYQEASIHNDKHTIAKIQATLRGVLAQLKYFNDSYHRGVVPSGPATTSGRIADDFKHAFWKAWENKAPDPTGIEPLQDQADVTPVPMWRGR